MTKENALVAYKHFRDLENNYEPLAHLNSGPTARHKVREKAKASADNILIRHPEFAEPPIPSVTPGPPKKEKKKDDGQ
ncbi:hypothetical protein LCGC14_2091660 [marine sediment metagenome]|uniref:Uncharacterized protein n=1 Tax=marine sediment metagenome TaxID=412755 RepID=A0A0F9F017_9ZZZZ